MVGRPTIATSPRRVARYDVVAPVCYRLGDQGGWLDGTTVNISHLGLLLRTRHPAPPLSTPIELRVRLSAGADIGADITCTGRVVWADAQADGDALLAIAIAEYAFEKRSLVTSQCGGALIPDSLRRTPVEED